MRFPSSISKINPPRFPHVLHRPRLIELLRQHRDKKLILILGPAAQGKSTLAVSWVNVSKTPSAWINLGPEDADPVNLFYLLVQSLERALPHQDFSLLAAYPAMALGPREEIPLYRDWARSLLGLVSVPLRITLDGLDQLPSEAPAYHFLQVLLDEAPGEVHFLMLSREIPPLKLEALKMRQAAYILHGEELAFSLEETREFLKVRRLSLPPRSVKQIHRLTDGWAGGLVLICEGLTQLPETDREEYLLGDRTEKYKENVFKYFGEQVFAALSPETQEFLIKSTILEVVDPDFIKDFLGVEQAREILDNLAERNLFIQPLYDKKRGWLYRYHLLFRDFLCAKFKALLGEEQQRAAYLRAGELSERRGEQEGAIKYYLKAKAYPQAASVIERIGMDLVKTGRAEDLYHWLHSIPEEFVEENPWLLFYRYLSKRFAGPKEHILNIQKAYSLFGRLGDVRGRLLTLAYLLDAAIFRGHFSLPLDYLLSRSETLLQSEDVDRYPYERATLWFQMGFVHHFKFGDPRKGFRACENAYLLARELGDLPLQFNALMHAFSNLSFLGEFSLAKEFDHKIQKLLSNFTCSTEMQAFYQILSAQYCIIRGELEKARPLVQDAKEKSETHGLTYLHLLALLYDQLLKIYLQEYEAAEEVGQQLQHLTLSLGNMYIQGVSLFLLGMNHYYKGDHPQRAMEILERSRLILAADETRAVYQMRMLDILMGALSSHLEGDGQAEQNLWEALDHFTKVSAHIFMGEARLALALLKLRQGRISEALAHLQAGFKIFAQKKICNFQWISRGDVVKLCILALEREIPEARDYAAHLLTNVLACEAGPELEKLLYHPDRRVVERAMEVRQAIHRGKVPPLRIQTLGGFRLWRGEAPIEEDDWEGNQPKQLLKAILTHGAPGVVKDVLLEDLWPEADPESAEKNFKVNLHRLRKALEPGLDKTFGSSYIHLKANLVQLDQELCNLDVNKFLDLIKEGEKKEDQGQLKEAIPLYKYAVARYGGDFLPEELYSPWATAKREELRGKYSELLHRLAGLHEKQGTLTRAIDCYKKAIYADAVDEPAYQRLMLLHNQRGMRSAALKVYQDCCQALKKELNTEPDEVTTAIHMKILAPPQS